MSLSPLPNRLVYVGGRFHFFADRRLSCIMYSCILILDLIYSQLLLIFNCPLYKDFAYIYYCLSRYLSPSPIHLCWREQSMVTRCMHLAFGFDINVQPTCLNMCNKSFIVKGFRQGMLQVNQDIF